MTEDESEKSAPDLNVSDETLVEFEGSVLAGAQLVRSNKEWSTGVWFTLRPVLTALSAIEREGAALRADVVRRITREAILRKSNSV